MLRLSATFTKTLSYWRRKNEQPRRLNHRTKVFLGCAIAALIAQEPTLALACCAMSGVLKIESEKE